MKTFFILATILALAVAQTSPVFLKVTDGLRLFDANFTGGALTTNFRNDAAEISGRNVSSEQFRGLAAIPGAGNSAFPYLALSDAGRLYRVANNGSARYLFDAPCADIIKSNPALSMDINPLNGLVAVFTITPGDTTTNFYYLNITAKTCAPQTRVTYPAGATPAVKALGLAYYYDGSATATLYLLSVDPASATNPAIRLYIVPATGGALPAAIGTTGIVSPDATGGLSIYYNYTTNTAVGIAVVYSAASATERTSVVASINLQTAVATNFGTLPATINPLAFVVEQNRPFGYIFTGDNTPGRTVAIGASITLILPSIPSPAPTSVLATAILGGATGTVSVPATVILQGNGQYTKNVVVEVSGSSSTVQATVAGTTESFTASFSGVVNNVTASATASFTAPAAQSTTTVQINEDNVGTALIGGVDRITAGPAASNILAGFTAGTNVQVTAGDASVPTVTSVIGVNYRASVNTGGNTNGGNTNGATNNGGNNNNAGATLTACVALTVSAIFVMLA